MAEAFVPSFLRSVSSVCVLGFLVVGLIGGFPLFLSLVSETLFQSVDPTALYEWHAAFTFENSICRRLVVRTQRIPKKQRYRGQFAVPQHLETILKQQ